VHPGVCAAYRSRLVLLPRQRGRERVQIRGVADALTALRELALVHRRLHDGHRATLERPQRATLECRPQRDLQLDERRFALGDAAQVALVEVQERRHRRPSRRRKRCSGCRPR
jgi:hypothetical protein